ncbi:peptide methionine sulfoxide reductase MsrB [mine drainage metagenome]|uniref:Peptide methionine sulfoxide reductase MsrB n=1 Tax=mine drainage metagenome TaxID=410659 RepID=A0A1J5RH01_9ZZZZ
MTSQRKPLIAAEQAPMAVLSPTYRRAMAATQHHAAHPGAAWSEDDWRSRLSPLQYAVLRRRATEPAGSSPLLQERRAGVFVCAGCARPLFTSAAKFDSGSGWPSFSAALDHAVDEENDPSGGETRTEVHCHRCGCHLGHVFEDGPPPSGRRYCINGTALTFLPER